MEKVVSSSRYKPGLHSSPRLIWLQQNQEVSDQAFNGYAIFAGAKHHVITSSRLEDTEGDPAGQLPEDSEIDDQQHSGPVPACVQSYASFQAQVRMLVALRVWAFCLIFPNDLFTERSRSRDPPKVGIDYSMCCNHSWSWVCCTIYGPTRSGIPLLHRTADRYPFNGIDSSSYQKATWAPTRTFYGLCRVRSRPSGDKSYLQFLFEKFSPS